MDERILGPARVAATVHSVFYPDFSIACATKGI